MTLSWLAMTLLKDVGSVVEASFPASTADQIEAQRKIVYQVIQSRFLQNCHSH